MFRRALVLALALWATGALALRAQGEWKLTVVAVLLGGQKVYVETVDTPGARAQGLMFRRELGPDQGMLFVYDQPQVLDFWMKNTLLPLSIAFIDDARTIVNIEDMEPLDEKSRTRSRRPCRWALEVNRDWFVRHGVKVGDRVGFLESYRPATGGL